MTLLTIRVTGAALAIGRALSGEVFTVETAHDEVYVFCLARQNRHQGEGDRAGQQRGGGEPGPAGGGEETSGRTKARGHRANLEQGRLKR